jgi:YD repeat-containing protein
VTTRVVGGAGYTLTYDAENRLTAVSGGATASFVYDGDGNRVKATVAGVTTAYVGNYYEWTGTAYKKYYYAGGQRVAMSDNGTLYWLLGDHLGSTSLTANFTTGALVAELRYKPWGENRYTSQAAMPTTYRFTGQRQECHESN